MTIKKLSKNDQDKLARQFIEGGGKTAEESNSNSSASKKQDLRFSLRIPKQLVEMIDDQCRNQVGNISRNTWILEAISQRLKNV